MYDHIAPITGKIVSIHPMPGHKSAQCEIIHTSEPGGIFLRSYNTIVAYYNLNTGTIYERKYSVTTSKHQTWFYHYICDTYNWQCTRKVL